MKTFWTIFITVIVMAGLGAGGYYYLSSKQTKEKNDLQAQIDDLNKKLSAAQSTTSTSTAATADTTANWKTYTNSQYGFSFKYPSDWVATENGGSNSDSSVVSLASPDTTAAYNAAGGLEGVYPDNISVYYYASVADETENKANNIGATTIDQLIQKSGTIQKIGSMTVGGISSTDVYWGGLGKYYAILTLRNNHLFKIWFSNVDDKSKLSAVETQILSTFQFTN